MENPNISSKSAADDSLLSDDVEEHCQNFILQPPPSLCPYAADQPCGAAADAAPDAPPLPSPASLLAEFQQNLSRKVYVHKVSPEIPGEKLMDYFRGFEGLTHVLLGWNYRHPTFNYALVNFDSAEGANKLLETPPEEFVIDARRFECHSPFEDCDMDCRVIHLGSLFSAWS